MAEKKKVYWDACMWFAVIKQEPGRYARCEYILNRAHVGEVEIWTSSLTLAEVFQKQCGAPGTPHGGLPADKDQEFEDFVAQDFVVEVQLDHSVGIAARRLLRQHGQLKKPQDAAHLASAVLNNLDEFHTFDRVNLLSLNGAVRTKNGGLLAICEPPEPPPPPRDLFSELEAQTQDDVADTQPLAAASGSSSAENDAAL